MATLTTDPNDPRLPRKHGPDEEPVEQQDVYLVLSEAERARGFVRPVRRTYQHVGIAGPTHPLRELTDEERERYPDVGYVAFEAYPPEPPYDPNIGNVPTHLVGRYWTQAQLDSVGKGCGAETTMGLAIAETYARDCSFYSGTYCAHCQKHRPVGSDGEFVWLDGSRVGT